MGVAIKSNFHSFTDLQTAIEQGNKDAALSYFRKNSFSASVPLPNGELPLHYAIRWKRPEIISEIAKERLASFEIRDHQGLSALDHAWIVNDPATLSASLQGAIGAITPSITPSYWLFGKEREIANMQNRIKSHITAQSNSEIHLKAARGDLSILKEHTDALNTFDKRGFTPLHYAILHGHEQLVNELIKKGCFLNQSTKDSLSIIHLAAASGNEIVLRDLIQKVPGAMDSPDASGRTPLHYAMASRSLSCSRVLIQHGANLLAQSCTTWSNQILTPLEIALTLSQKESALKDPLALSNGDWILFFSAVAAGVSMLYTQNPGIAIASQTMSAIGTLSLMGEKSLANWITYFVVSSVPELSLIAKTWSIYSIGKRSLNGLAACWKNRFVETYRPLRNAFVHMITGAAQANEIPETARKVALHTQALHCAARAASSYTENPSPLYRFWYTPEQKIEKLSEIAAEEMAHFYEHHSCSDQGGTPIWSFFQALENSISSYAEWLQNLLFSESWRMNSLDSKTVNGAKAILNFGRIPDDPDGFAPRLCKKLVRRLQQKYHPDKSTKDASISEKINGALSTLQAEGTCGKPPEQSLDL